VRVQRLITFYSVCVIELTSRRGQILGSTSHPDAALMWQIVRKLTVADSGGFALLICDRDAMWSAAVRARLQDAGLRVIQTPYRTPNANACAGTVRPLDQREMSESFESVRRGQARLSLDAFTP
jgi:hypothetical protein